MGFSVGFYESFDPGRILSAHEMSLSEVTSRCVCVSVWHDTCCTQVELTTVALASVPSSASRVIGFAQLRGRRTRLDEIQPVEGFLDVLSREPAVHQRHMLVMTRGNEGVVLVTDVDGSILDVLVSGPGSVDLGRDLAGRLWGWLIEPTSTP